MSGTPSGTIGERHTRCLRFLASRAADPFPPTHQPLTHLQPVLSLVFTPPTPRPPSPAASAGRWAASGERPSRHRRAAEQARTYLALDIQSSIDKSDKVVEQVVGPVGESRRDHLKRCQQPRCPRCRWYQVGHKWQATYGSLEADAGPRGKIIWLSQRPARWGGAWALGCSLCAAALARRQVLCDTAGTQKPKNAGGAEHGVPIAPGLGMRPGLHSCRLSM